MENVWGCFSQLWWRWTNFKNENTLKRIAYFFETLLHVRVRCQEDSIDFAEFAEYFPHFIHSHECRNGAQVDNTRNWNFHRYSETMLKGKIHVEFVTRVRSFFYIQWFLSTCWPEKYIQGKIVWFGSLDLWWSSCFFRRSRNENQCKNLRHCLFLPWMCNFKLQLLILLLKDSIHN